MRGKACVVYCGCFHPVGSVQACLHPREHMRHQSSLLLDSNLLCRFADLFQLAGAVSVELAGGPFIPVMQDIHLIMDCSILDCSVMICCVMNCSVMNCLL
jgi:hypothetical protein